PSIARTAVSRLPNAVITMMGADPASSRNLPRADSPSIPGSRTSRMMASRGPRPARSSPSSADDATSISCPRSPRNSRSAQQMLASSSTTRTRLIGSARLAFLATAGQGQPEPGECSFSCPGDASMMRQGHMPGQSKTKSNALRLAAHERLEQSFTELRRRSWAGVGNLDDSSVTVVSQLERDGAARTGGFDGIEGKIEHRGAEAGLVGHRRRGWRASADPKGDPGMLTGRLKQRGDVVKQTNQVAGGMRPLFESTERQEAQNLLFHQRKLAQSHRHAG